MKTKLVLLITALSLLLLSVGCKSKTESALIAAAPGARIDQDGTIYVSHVLPADLTLTKQPTNFTIAFPFPMDQSSVEQALQVCDGVEYSFRWSDMDFLITIIRGAEEFRSCTISLGGSVESLDGEVFPRASWELIVQLATSTPTRTPAPTRTPGPTNTPTASPTILSFSTLPPLFPTATQSHIIWETTTPIPTPSISTADFKLAQLSIDDYIALIQELDQYAFANDLLGLGEHRYAYPEFQYPMKFAVLEALSSFPHSNFTEELEWKLALINATAELPESDDWIIQALENALNQGRLTPPEINVYLNQFGFKVGSQAGWAFANPDVSNLFGDGITQSVFVINSDSNHNHIGSASDGILITLRGDQPGEFDLVKLYSRYNFAAGSWIIGCGPENLDIDKDGIAEICAYFTLGYSFFFPTDLYLLEWQGDHFFNLAKSVPKIQVDWDYVFTPGLPGVDIMIEKHLGPIYSHGYVFNDNNFEMVYSDPAIDLIDELVAEGSYTQAVSEIERLLSMKTVVKILETDRLATGLQKLEFTAALVYALDNQSSQAKQTLHELLETIDPQEQPQMLNAVQGFNQIYYDAADLYLACQAVLDILTPAYQEEYDYYWDYQYPVTDYCRSSAPILAAIKLIDPTATTDLPTILRNSGIEVLQSNPISALNDGNQDWVISTLLLTGNDQSVYSDDQSTILAIQHNGQWFAQEVNTPYSATKNLSASHANLPGLPFPAVVILDGQDIVIVDINLVQGKVTFDTLLNENATSYRFITNDSTFLKTIEFKDYCNVDEYVFMIQDFRWNEIIKSFEKGDPVTNLLFSQEVTPATIATLQNLYQEISANFQTIERFPEDCSGGAYIDYRSRILHAIGLAYELTGDTANAVQTFYRVWTEFPETPYAIMARAKLAPLSP